MRVGSIELGCVLGVGGFGKVYLGHDMQANKDCAVKVIDKNLIRQHNLQEYIEREIDIMRKLEHPHVIRLVQAVDFPNSYCLVMELAPNGELFDKILQSKRFDEATARSYFQQLMSAVTYCHRKGVVHRDLKAENLLLGEDGSLKVCDFGLSRYTFQAHLPDGHVTFTSLAGSTDYQAPEVLEANGYHGFTCDIWSVGVILFFMLCGYLPFSARSEEETEQRVLSARYNQNDKHLSDEARDLLGHLLEIDVKKRFTAEQILEHPWFVVDLDESLFPDMQLSSPVFPRDAFALKPAAPTQTTSAGARQDADNMVASLRRAFHTINVDHSGHLKRAEFRDVLIELNDGEPVQDEEVDRVMRCFQLDRDGTVSETEFICGWTKLESLMKGKIQVANLVSIFHIDLEQGLLADLRRAFDRLDINHNGVLTAENVMAIPELCLTQDEARQLIEAMDRKHHRQTVTFEDFVDACTKADLLRRHAIGTKLQRLGDLFEAVDAHFSLAYLNTGFTVAGLREQILRKLLSPRAMETAKTQFAEGESGSYVHGTHISKGSGREVQIGVQLLPACTGYTKVLSYRICGRTEDFHLWFALFRRLLHEEIVRCTEDTSVAGESELI